MKRILSINKNNLLALIFIYSFIFFSTINAQESESKKFIGNWITGYNIENSLKIGSSYIRVAFVISQDGEILLTKMTSPDGDIFNANADETTIEENKIKISFGSIKADYIGEINQAGNQLNGRFSIMGKTYSLSFKKIRVD